MTDRTPPRAVRPASPALAMLFVLVAALAAAGCARHPAAAAASRAPSKAASSKANSTANSAPFKVALMTPGPVSDAGWNAAAFRGLMLIKHRMGAKTALVQTTSPSDFDDAFRDFASRGFKLIFAHGFEYTDSALRLGKLFPKTWFVVTSGHGSSANVASLTFRIEEATYVEGVLAGMMTKTGVVGAVGGIELPSIRLTFAGFEQGFHSVRPNGRVLVSYTGSFNDVGAAKEAAAAEIMQHADLLVHNADAAGLGVFLAAEQAHVYAFGANANQNSVAPTAVLASAVTDIPQAFLKVAQEVKAGTFHPGMIEYGMADGMVNVVFNRELVNKIPPAAMARAMAAEAAIKSGRITIKPPAPAN